MANFELGTVCNDQIYGSVRIVGTDITGRVLIEAMEAAEIPEWPFKIAPGHREWVSSISLISHEG